MDVGDLQSAGDSSGGNVLKRWGNEDREMNGLAMYLGGKNKTQ